MGNLTDSAVFGATVVISYRLDLPNTIGDPIALALVGPLGATWARDAGRLVSFGLIYYVYRQFIWPNLRGYLV